MTAKLYEALAAAQLEMGAAIKDSQNPQFRSRYADLASVWEAWRQVGPKNGLSIIQRVQDAGERTGVLIETILAHSSGETLSTTAFFPLGAKQDAQAYGSAITYGRRYCMAAMVGIVQDDDDGNAASAPTGKDPVVMMKEKADQLRAKGDVEGMRALANTDVVASHQRLAEYLQKSIDAVKAAKKEQQK